MVADEETGIDRDHTEDRRPDHHRTDAPGEQCARTRRGDEQPEHEQRTHCLERDDDGEGDHDQHHVVIQAHRETGHLSLLRVEAEQQERPGADERRDGDDDRRHELDHDGRDAGAQDLAEKDLSQVAGEGI